MEDPGTLPSTRRASVKPTEETPFRVYGNKKYLSAYANVHNFR